MVRSDFDRSATANDLPHLDLLSSELTICHAAAWQLNPVRGNPDFGFHSDSASRKPMT